MNNKATTYRYLSFFLGLVVLFFTLKVGVNSFECLITNSVAAANDDDDDDVFHSFGYIAENNGVKIFDVNIKEMKKLNVSSFLLMDFDDLEFSFSTSLNSSTRACFFQHVILKYNSCVYKNVKLFLFYSFIKIPSASL